MNFPAPQQVVDHLYQNSSSASRVTKSGQLAIVIAAGLLSMHETHQVPSVRAGERCRIEHGVESRWRFVRVPLALHT